MPTLFQGIREAQLRQSVQERVSLDRKFPLWTVLSRDTT